VASNFALLSGARSSTGHPLMIGGPQIGYFYPTVPFEVDIESPHIHMRGLTAPSYPGYVFVGRGTDFAWTINVAPVAASATVSVPLCSNDTGYLVGTQCRPIQTINAGNLTNLNNLLASPQPVTFRQTEFGPINAVVDDTGTDVALVEQTPSAGHDALDMLGFRAVNYGETHGPTEFRHSMQQTPQAFNVGYIDSKHISAFLTCWCINPSDFTTPQSDPVSRVIPVSSLPATVDPPHGLITNWNETLQAPGGVFQPPANGQFRADWYQAFDARRVHTPASLVGAMNGQATRYSAPGYTSSFFDFFPPLGGARPKPIETTDRSTAIQIVMSFK
jgi:hypothetical protein